MIYTIKTLCLTIFFGLLLSGCSGDKKNKIKETETTVDKLKVKNEIPEFEINFPKTKYVIKKNVSNNPNMPKVTNWILEGKDKNGPFMYCVAHNTLSKKIENLINIPNQLDIALKAMLTSSAENLGGFDFEYNKTDYHGYPGMASECKVFEGNGHIKSVVYVIDKNIFFISGGGKNINIDTLNTFLASFELKK